MNVLTPPLQIEPIISPVSVTSVAELAAFKKSNTQPNKNWAIVSIVMHIAILLLVILVASHRHQTIQAHQPTSERSVTPIISYLHLPTSPNKDTHKTLKQDIHNKSSKNDTHTLNTVKQTIDATDTSFNKQLQDEQSEPKIKDSQTLPQSDDNAQIGQLRQELPVDTSSVTESISDAVMSKPPKTPLMTGRTTLPKSTLQALNKMGIAKQQSMAADEAQAYYRQQTSPTLTPLNARKDTWQLPQQPANIKVYCDTVASKSAAFISGLTGGSVRCVDLPNFQQYIDKRLNTTATNK